MYLSSIQHSNLRTLVMDFEIPYRSFVACKILDTYKTESDFYNAILSNENLIKTYVSINEFASEYGKIKSNTHKYFTLLNNAYNAIGKDIQHDEIDVPYLSTLNIFILTFPQIFSDYISRFYDSNSFWEKATRIHYVRNKLSHPGCKTLEKDDLDVSLEFISTTITYLKNLDSHNFFWKISSETLDNNCYSLSSENWKIPIDITNFQDMPFPDSKIICREREVAEIKEFVYGKPGALRKKSSYCLFGYGGVGKTALVLESIKCIVQDLIDNTTINNYNPDFLLFFSAKQEELTISATSGSLEQQRSNYNFNDFDSLKNIIFSSLNISDFSNFNKQGLIIIDNLETLVTEERNKIRDFIDYNTPSNIQFIITSRNEEPFSERKLLGGFSDIENCKKFISEYIVENSLDLNLSNEDIGKLLNITKGNTLVLVLCIKRLDRKFDTIQGLQADFSQTANIGKIVKELQSIPANGYEMISEYMFKNTFNEIIKIYPDNAEIIYSILKILAVYPTGYVDIFTLCMLSKHTHLEIEPIIVMLCKYLIVERKNNEYCLNEFAGKYIIFKLLPDHESYLKLSQEIDSSIRKIKFEREELAQQTHENPNLKRIISDWNILSEGDKIAAAKVFRLYGEIRRDCGKSSFFINAAYEETMSTFKELERSTAHPYIQYQKARILQKLLETNLLDQKKLSEQIINAFQECIFIIKTSSIYSCIKKTKSYASILWLFGMQLMNYNSSFENAAKYFEESIDTFKELNIQDDEYFQCVSYAGRNYLHLYESTKETKYLKLSRSMSELLKINVNKYSNKIKNYSINLRNDLKKYIPTLN